MKNHRIDILTTAITVWLLLWAIPLSLANDTPIADAPEGDVQEMRIGVALGGGGANGLAHIAMIEVLDEFDVTPHCIAGTSIGSIIGALYASGQSGAEIRELVNGITVRRTDTWQERLLDLRLFRWARFVDPELGQGGLLSADSFVRFLKDELDAETFDDLKIPLYVVTTDYWAQEQTVYHEGDMLEAIKASMAIPGIFSPVIIDGRPHVDGGLVNPVPFDILFDSCNFIIAIDVLGEYSEDEDISFVDAAFRSFRIMQHQIVRGKKALREPDIYIETNIHDVRMLQFHKFQYVCEQARGAAETLRKQLIEYGFEKKP